MARSIKKLSILLSIAASASMLLACPQQAQAAEVACTASAGFDTCRRFTNTTNADQTFTVPAGVTSIRVKMWGAGGGGVDGNYSTDNAGGGGGGYTTGTIAVTPGQVLTVVVGQGGTARLWSATSGGTAGALATYGGGGAGGANTHAGAPTGGAGSSGGGMSALFLAGGKTAANALLVAGGGGGGSPGADVPCAAAGANCTASTVGPRAESGGGGGTTGGQATGIVTSGPLSGITGQGGTQVGGGAGASATGTQDPTATGGSTANCSPAPASAGAQFQGGAGSSVVVAAPGTGYEGGGGGGGGWFGGGGGKCQGRFSGTTSATIIYFNNGPGGGGSSYTSGPGVTAASTTAGTNGTYPGNGTAGSFGTAGNNTDTQYVAGTGNGGNTSSFGSATAVTGGNGLVVLEFVGTDLSITKTDGQTTYSPGQWVNYTITITNNGTVAVSNAVFRDAAVAGLSISNIRCVASGATCPTITATGATDGVPARITQMQSATGIAIPSLPVGGSVTFTVSGAFHSTATTSITNTATIATPTGVTDGNPGNNSADDTDNPVNVPTFTSCPSGAAYVNWAGTAASGTGTSTGSGGLTPALPNLIYATTNTGSVSITTAESLVATGGTDNGWASLFGASPSGNVNWNLSVNGSFSTPNVQTITFNAPTIPSTWGFLLADLDVEQIRIQAFDNAGVEYSVAEVNSWYRGVYDANTTDGVNLPRWLPGEAWAMGAGSGGDPPAFPPGTHFTSGTGLPSADDTSRASIWFTPDQPVKRLVITYQNIGSGTDRLYMASCLLPPPTVTLNKTTVGGGGAFGFALTNTTQTTGTVTTPSATTTQVDGNTGMAGTQAFTVSTVGTDVTINENSMPSGWTLTGAICTSAGNTVGSLTGSTYTIPGTDVVIGAAITCTYTNSLTTADLSITKTNTPALGPNDQGTDTVTSGSTVNYDVVVSNAGPAAANGAVLRDPAPSGMTCTAVSCAVASGSAVCPAATVAALQSAAGVAIAVLPANSSLTFTLTCTVQ